MSTNRMLQPMAPIFLAILRVVAGILLFEHGTQKILHFPVSEMHPPMFSLLWVGGILEIVGGALIVLGLFTRISAFVLSGMMAVAYFMFHAPSSLYPANNGGDAAILFCFIFLYLVFAGPGSFSLDGKRK
ncbi:DoxX family protein [Martelella mediterranea]|uniref:DoxX family protein n=1 Tax=Martelella mediterranea TaxID=293089 RepID=UPI001E5B1727|nr:DoxX family protein [Martelella mediterranea]MCD1636484.1 DoxX family protein [Martelella mediterranea]